MNPSITDNHNQSIYSQTQTQSQTTVAGPWQSPLGKSTIGSASVASSGSATITTNVGSPQLPPPGQKPPVANTADAEGVSYSVGLQAFKLKSLDYNEKEVILSLKKIIAKDPDATIPGTQPPVRVIDLLKSGTAENDIFNYLYAPVDPPIPLNKLNIASSIIDTGSQSPDYVISQKYNIKVQDLSTKGTLANAINSFLDGIDQKIADRTDAAAAAQFTPFPDLSNTGATQEQIDSSMAEIIKNMPDGATKTIFQFLEENGGTAGLEKKIAEDPSYASKIVIEATPTSKAVTVADLISTKSPEHAFVVESSAMRQILSVLIQLNNMLNKMKTWCVDNLQQLQNFRQAQLEEQQVATNKQVSDNNKNIQAIQKAVEESLKAQHQSKIFGILSAIISAVAIVVTIATAGAASPLAALAIAVSATMFGCQIYDLATGTNNSFLDQAQQGLAEAVKSMMSKIASLGVIGKVLGVLVALAVVVAVIAVAKGASAGMVANEASTATKMAVTMATVAVLSTFLAGSNIVGDAIANCFNNPDSEAAQIASAVVQMVVILVFSLVAGKMMMGGSGAAAGASSEAKNASNAASDLGKDASTLANATAKKVQEAAEEGTELKQISENIGEASSVGSSTTAVFSTSLSDAVSTANATQTAEVSSKEMTEELEKTLSLIEKLKRNLAALMSRLESLLNDSLLGKTLSGIQKSATKISPTTLKKLARGAEQLNTAAGLATSSVRGILGGMTSLKQAELSKVQVDLTISKTDIEALIGVLDHAITQTKENSEQVQKELNRINDLAGQAFDDFKKAIAELTSLLQKIESV